MMSSFDEGNGRGRAGFGLMVFFVGRTVESREGARTAGFTMSAPGALSATGRWLEAGSGASAEAEGEGCGSSEGMAKSPDAVGALSTRKAEPEAGASTDTSAGGSEEEAGVLEPNAQIPTPTSRAPAALLAATHTRREDEPVSTGMGGGVSLGDSPCRIVIAVAETLEPARVGSAGIPDAKRAGGVRRSPGLTRLGSLAASQARTASRCC